MRYHLGTRPQLSTHMKEELEESQNNVQVVRSHSAKAARRATITMVLTAAVGAVIGHFMAGSDGTV